MSHETKEIAIENERRLHRFKQTLSGLDAALDQVEAAALEQDRNLNIFYQMIRHSPAPACLINSSSRYVMWSESWERNFGPCEVGGAIARSGSPVLNGKEESWESIHARVLKGDVKEGLEWKSGEGGSPVYVEWRMERWLDASGEVGGMMILTNLCGGKCIKGMKGSQCDQG